jgi:[ribosomal protein S18]-alanine N-acetyltransferase
LALREPHPDPYRVDPARFDDLDEVLRIERESFPIPWKREFFESELVEPYRYARVLTGGPGVAPRIGGYLFAVSLYEEFHINKIATDERLRRLGYGKRLLEDALARARTVGATAVTLEVRVSNFAALQFYAAQRFREAYRRKAYYQDGEDAFAMVLPLGVKR